MIRLERHPQPGERLCPEGWLFPVTVLLVDEDAGEVLLAGIAGDDVVPYELVLAGTIAREEEARRRELSRGHYGWQAVASSDQGGGYYKKSLGERRTPGR